MDLPESRPLTFEVRSREQLTPLVTRVAMQFVLNWQERWDKLNSKTGIRYAGETEADKFTFEHSPWRKLTRTGKPPKELKRIEVEIKLADPTEEEKFKADPASDRDSLRRLRSATIRMRRHDRWRCSPDPKCRPQ